MEHGETGAADRLLDLVYDELRRVAAGKMALERPGGTLQATAMVHETWLRLGGDNQPNWQNRAHFFGAAAEAMRRILIENARRKKAGKHGGGLDRIDLASVDVAIRTDDEHLLLVDEALEKLAAKDPEAAQLIKLRFFAGMSNEEAAKTMGLAVRSATRLWAYARAWLYREISGNRS